MPGLIVPGGALLLFESARKFAQALQRATEIAWTDLDLSTWLPAGATHAIITSRLCATVGDVGEVVAQNAAYRKKGESGAAREIVHKLVIMSAGNAGPYPVSDTCTIIVGVDGSGFVQYKVDHDVIELATWQLTVHVMGGLAVREQRKGGDV